MNNRKKLIVISSLIIFSIIAIYTIYSIMTKPTYDMILLDAPKQNIETQATINKKNNIKDIEITPEEPKKENALDPEKRNVDDDKLAEPIITTGSDGTIEVRPNWESTKPTEKPADADAPPLAP